MPAGSIRRVTVPLGDGEDCVMVEPVGTANVELARINEAFAGRPYRYAYAQRSSEPGTWWDGLVKVDMLTGEETVWSRPDHWPAEPLFVARPGGVDEDDGVVLVTVLGGDGPAAGSYGTSYLLVLDARTMQPLAEARGPVRIPFTSHGNWYEN